MPWNSRTFAIFLTAVVIACSTRIDAQNYTFEEVASGLKHSDPATRMRAIEILRDADYPEAAAPIGATLADGDDRVQLAAIEAEHALFTGPPVTRRRKVGFLVEVRSTPSSDAAAERQLSLKPRAVPMDLVVGLAVALRDESPRVRSAAIDLTALIVPRVCRFTAQHGDDVCSRLGNALIDNINSRDPLVRRAAMRALGLVRYPSAVQALTDQLSYYQDGPDARAALEGLAGIGHITTVSIFKQLLASSDASTRRLAVEGLARSGEPDAAADLERMAQSEPSGEVLLALHFANVRLHQRADSVAPLVAALRNRSLRSFAVAYLLDVPEMAPELSRYLQDSDSETRRVVADVLGFSGDHGVIPALEAASKDVDTAAAAAAARAISRIKLQFVSTAPRVK